MGQDKALDLDGFQLFFFKFFWEDAKMDLIRLMEDISKGTSRLDRINYSVITLIPKKCSPWQIGDYRPIALLNSTIKKVSKILANKLVLKLKILVMDYQTDFIAGRNILEGVATTYEVIYYYKKSKTNGFMLKLDFGKAYNMIDWECLLKTLKLKGLWREMEGVD